MNRAHVAHVAKFLAELRGVAYEELVAATQRNTREFFGMEPRVNDPCAAGACPRALFARVPPTRGDATPTSWIRA